MSVAYISIIFPWVFVSMVNTVTDIIQAIRFPYFSNTLIHLFVSTLLYSVRLIQWQKGKEKKTKQIYRSIFTYIVQYINIYIIYMSLYIYMQTRSIFNVYIKYRYIVCVQRTYRNININYTHIHKHIYTYIHLGKYKIPRFILKYKLHTEI